MKLKGLLAPVLIAAAVFSIYSNVLRGPFIFDDTVFVMNNARITDMANFWPPSGIRYLAFLSFALNYSAGGFDTFGYHLVNVCVHAGASLLLFWTVLLLFRTPWLRQARLSGDLALPTALLAAFLFATHPVQTQAVSYITQRFASMATLFYLLSVALYLKWRTGGKGRLAPALYLGSLASAAAAQLTKEIAFTLPFVIAAIELAFMGGLKGSAARLARLTPFALTLAIVPLLLFGPEIGLYGGATGVTESTRGVQIADLGRSRSEYLFTQFRVIATYMRLLVLPVGQNLNYDYPRFSSIFEPQVAASLLLMAAVLAGAGWLAFRGMRRKGPLATLGASGIFFFFTALSVESSVIPIKDVIFEHRLYLPAAGAAVSFAALLLWAATKALPRTSPLYLAMALTLLVAVPLSAATYARNSLWADEVAFWRDVAAKSPRIAGVRNNLGTVYYKRGMGAEAEQEFRAALALDPGYAEAHFNLGTYYRDLGLMEKAVVEYEAAVAADPGKTRARNNLALALSVVGRNREAAAQLRALLELDPGNYRAYNNLGIIYSDMGMREEAGDAFSRALALRPDFAQAYDNLRRLEQGGAPTP